MPDGTTVVADRRRAAAAAPAAPGGCRPGARSRSRSLLHPGLRSRARWARCRWSRASRSPRRSIAAGRCRAASARLKWPNDVLLGRAQGGRHSVREPRAAAAPGDAVVVGVGVNVAQAAGEFPPELAGHATSLALAGVRVDARAGGGGVPQPARAAVGRTRRGRPRGGARALARTRGLLGAHRSRCARRPARSTASRGGSIPMAGW